MKIKTDRYIFPPRAKTCLPREEVKDQNSFFAKLGYTAQLKYNDTRTLIKYLPIKESSEQPKIELWNRHGEKLRNYHCPDWLQEQLQTVHQILNLDPNELQLLDGGLLDQKHRALKDTLVIWDILVLNGEHQTGTTYNERYNKINSGNSGISSLEQTDYNFTDPNTQKTYKLGECFTEKTPNIFYPLNWTPEEWPNLWQLVDEINQPYLKAGIGPLIEGMALKLPSGILSSGFRADNNGDWMVRSRVATNRHAF